MPFPVRKPGKPGLIVMATLMKLSRSVCGPGGRRYHYAGGGLWLRAPELACCSLLTSQCFRLQVKELQSLGFGPKEGSLQALFQHGGDVARALTELQRQRLEPFHQRLWDRGPEPTPCWDGLDRQVLRVGKKPNIPLKGIREN